MEIKTDISPAKNHPEERKQIKVSPGCISALKAAKSKGESYEQLIFRLLSDARLGEPAGGKSTLIAQINPLVREFGLNTEDIGPLVKDALKMAKFEKRKPLNINMALKTLVRAAVVVMVAYILAPVIMAVI